MAEEEGEKPCDVWVNRLAESLGGEEIENLNRFSFSL